MPWFAARHAAHPCQTGPRQEVCGRNGVISWLGVPSSGRALTNKHISYHELSKRETRATAVTSGALLSSLGGSGAVGFLNAPTGSASLYPTDTVLRHSLLESKASEGQKPALETGGLWLRLAPSLPPAVHLKISWDFLQARGGEAGHRQVRRSCFSPPRFDPLSPPTGTAAPPQGLLPLSHCQPILPTVRPAVSPLTSATPLLRVTDQVSCKKDMVPHKQRGIYLSVRPMTNPYACWLLFVLGVGTL